MHRKRLYAILLSASMIAGQGAMPVMAEEILVIDQQQTEGTEDTSAPAEEEVAAEDIIITEEAVPEEVQGDVVEEDIIIPETEEVTEEIIPEVQEENIEATVDAIAVEEEAIQEQASAFDEITVEEEPAQAVGDIANTWEVNSRDEWFNAMNNAAYGDIIKLKANIDVTDGTLRIGSDKNITIDIGTYKLAIRDVVINGTLTITGTTGILNRTGNIVNAGTIKITGGCMDLNRYIS